MMRQGTSHRSEATLRQEERWEEPSQKPSVSCYRLFYVDIVRFIVHVDCIVNVVKFEFIVDVKLCLFCVIDVKFIVDVGKLLV